MVTMNPYQVLQNSSSCPIWSRILSSWYCWLNGLVTQFFRRGRLTNLCARFPEWCTTLNRKINSIRKSRLEGHIQILWNCSATMTMIFVKLWLKSFFFVTFVNLPKHIYLLNCYFCIDCSYRHLHKFKFTFTFTIRKEAVALWIFCGESLIHNRDKWSETKFYWGKVII